MLEGMMNFEIYYENYRPFDTRTSNAVNKLFLFLQCFY